MNAGAAKLLSTGEMKSTQGCASTKSGRMPVQKVVQAMPTQAIEK
jgi:hypothetical protein